MKNFVCSFAIRVETRFVTRSGSLSLERLLHGTGGPGKVNAEASTSGQSYKQFTLINYDSRVVVTRKLQITIVEAF